jgi:hypothetical protein
MLLDITREEVETRTHWIVHLEHHVEERAEMIANLEQAPPEHVDHQEADAMSRIDED